MMIKQSKYQETPATVNEKKPAKSETSQQTITIVRPSRVKKRKAILDWTQIAANLLVPITLIVASFSVYNNYITTKQNASSRIIERFYSPEMRSAQLALFETWDNFDFSPFPNGLPIGVMQEIAEAEINAMAPEAKNRVESSLLALATYFDQVDRCISLGRCDESVVREEIGLYARNLHCLYVREIDRLRRENLVLSVGRGLMNFATYDGECGR